MVSIPEVTLCTGSRQMPLLGLGTATYPFVHEGTVTAIIQAIALGYRHFDTASLYLSEKPLGEAIVKAQQLGLIKSRDELFITSKLWCNEAHPDHVLPALQKTLGNLKTDYLDLYLIHFPMSSKPGTRPYPINPKDLVPQDIKAVWGAMEECQSLGLVKSIGVSNFYRKKLEELLAVANVPPAVNQVEMNPVWQQQELREFCKEKGIHVTAYSPLGGQNDQESTHSVRKSTVLEDIAKAREKTVAQVSLRWVHEQGVSMVPKSFNKERIKENLQIFDWKLSNEEHQKISQIPQCRKINSRALLSEVTPECSGMGLSDDEN